MKNSKQEDSSKLDLMIEYWSSYGEIQLIINGTRYLYQNVDVAVIRRFLYFVRIRRQPGHALNYLKSHAKGQKVDCYA